MYVKIIDINEIEILLVAFFTYKKTKIINKYLHT